MNAPLKTSPVPPSIALAGMVWRKAWKRCFGLSSPADGPMPRAHPWLDMYHASSEYYRIIDRISRGEQP